MSDSLKSRVPGSTSRGMTICQVQWPAEQYTLEILRLLSSCPHQQKLLQALWLTEDDATAASFAALHATGLTYVADTDRRLTALMHLVPAPDPGREQGGPARWEMDTLILDEEAPEGTLDALLEAALRLNPDPVDLITTRTPAQSEALVAVLSQRGFAVVGTECTALTPCRPLPAAAREPRLRIASFPGRGEETIEPAEETAWLGEALSRIGTGDPSGKVRINAEAALQAALEDPLATVLVAYAEDDLPLGILTYRTHNPLLGEPDGSTAVIETFLAISKDHAELAMQQLHQQALHELHQQGFAQALYRYTQPADENLRESRVARLRRVNLLRQLGYQLITSRILLAYRPERFTLQPESSMKPRRDGVRPQRRERNLGFEAQKAAAGYGLLGNWPGQLGPRGQGGRPGRSAGRAAQ